MLRRTSTTLLLTISLTVGLVACASDSDDGSADVAADITQPTEDVTSVDTGDVPACVPKCSGLQCGDDGCGGTCGACPDGRICDEAGQCACAPCGDKECGSDGCGGSCGTCETGFACEANQCVCAPSCEGKRCGTDGCGGSCGTCEAGSNCEDHQCICAPVCGDKQCGPDTCGGSCGTCGAGERCDPDGQCQCEPQCSGKTCGANGCGGSCGQCSEDEVCSKDKCCSPQCEGKECGDDGCGGTCGACADELYYCVNGTCQPPCEPKCDDKECGSDGCGGACGICGSSTPVCMQGQCRALCTGCAVSGKVYYPNGALPVAGALVYLSLIEPEPLPDFVYCDTCTDLTFLGVPSDISEVNGSFQILAPSPGTYYLVVEKGGFRRVSTVDVAPFSQAKVPATQTTLPKVSNAEAGDHTPSIAVIDNSFDSVEDTLVKLGLQTTPSSNSASSTASVDLFDSNSAPNFFSQWENLMQYHIIFFPCDSDWFGDALENPAVVEVLRSYVEAGGKLYVTDWSYDIMKAVFPEPMAWEDDEGTPNSAQVPSYDAPAEAVDAGLGAWLGTQGVTDLTVEANYTILASTSAFQAPDADGDMTTMTPKVWVESDVSGYGKRPATVTFQYGCGRGMFSTYHTEGYGGASLLPQELALAYILLEFTSCAPSKDVPWQ